MRTQDIKRLKGSGVRSTGYSFEAVLEVMGQKGGCSKTFVDSQSRVFVIPSYDGAVRVYRLPHWITECSEIKEIDDNGPSEGTHESGGGVRGHCGGSVSSGVATGRTLHGRGGSPDSALPLRGKTPKMYPSSTLYDDTEHRFRALDGSMTTGSRMPVTALTMSDDCKRMVTGSNDNLVKIWDMQREEIVHRFEGHEGFIWNVKGLDSELNTAVSTSTDGHARRWDLRQRACTGSINVCAHGPGNVMAVTGVALRGNGYHMAVGSFDSNVYVLDIRMMKRLYSVGRHSDKVCRAHLYDEGESDLLVCCLECGGRCLRVLLYVCLVVCVSHCLRVLLFVCLVVSSFLLCVFRVVSTSQMPRGTPARGTVCSTLSRGYRLLPCSDDHWVGPYCAAVGIQLTQGTGVVSLPCTVSGSLSYISYMS